MVPKILEWFFQFPTILNIWWTKESIFHIFHKHLLQFTYFDQNRSWHSVSSRYIFNGIGLKQLLQKLWKIKFFDPSGIIKNSIWNLLWTWRPFHIGCRCRNTIFWTWMILFLSNATYAKLDIVCRYIPEEFRLLIKIVTSNYVYYFWGAVTPLSWARC